MSYPPPLMPYAGYADPYLAVPRPPTSIKAIGITGIVLGGLTLANHALGILMFLTLPITTSAYGPDNKPFQIANSAVFGAAAAVLVAGSIGSLARADWGRRTLLAYAIVYPVLLVVGTGLTVAWFIPKVMTPHEAGPDGPAKVMAAYAAAVVIGLAMMVLPILILVFFRRPYVRAAFAPAAPTAV